MRGNSCEAGSIEGIVAALKAAGAEVTESGGKVQGDQSKREALYAEMKAAQEAATDPMERQAALIRMQEREASIGGWDYSLGCNINGWCVGSSMKSNMGGGRWSQSGSQTLEGAIRWGIEEGSKPGCSFSFSFRDWLPEEKGPVLAAFSPEPSEHDKAVLAAMVD